MIMLKKFLVVMAAMAMPSLALATQLASVVNLSIIIESLNHRLSEIFNPMVRRLPMLLIMADAVNVSQEN